MTYKKFFALSLEKGIEQIQITENTTESSQIKLINNKTILITGATGLVGSLIIKTLHPPHIGEGVIIYV